MATLLREVIAEVVVHNVRVAEQIGLSPRDMQAIHLLQLRGPLTPGQLGGAVGLASAGTTALVDRLEASGFVRRKRDTADRRRVLVNLDEELLSRKLAPHFAHQALHLAKVSRRFDAAELAVVARFLEALASDQRD